MRSESFGSVKVFWPLYNREELIDLLRRRIAGLAAHLPIQRAVLFGSWARGRATAFSDIDLLVIYRDPPSSDAYELVRRHVDLPGLEPHVYAESEASAIQGTIDRMAQDGIGLLAAEP